MSTTELKEMVNQAETHTPDVEAADGKERSRSRRQADELVELAAPLDLYHDGETAYADARLSGRRETWELTSPRATNYLRRAYWQRTGRTPNAQALSDARALLIARALYDGENRPVHLRVAEAEGKMYLDLCDEGWRAVEITADGWKIVGEPPVRFRRPGAALALPEPEKGGNVADLATLLNVRSEDDLYLLVGWLLGALSPRGPYPLLALHGEQGSAKTTTARLLRLLVDPSRSPVRAEPRDVDDLLIAARHSHVVALDNLSHIPGRLSDALCRLATGGGLGKRELYSDADEVILEAIRPVLITGIEDVATRADLLDRATLVVLPAIPDDRRQTERDYWHRADSIRPRILGALLDGIVGALRDERITVLQTLPRMADHARWVTAAEPALGWPRGTYLRAYNSVRDCAAFVSIEASVIGPLVQVLPLPWEGTARDLLDKLAQMADEQARRSRSWPQSHRGLAGMLRRLAPSLRSVGIGFEERRTSDRARRRMIYLEAIGNPASKPSEIPRTPDDSDRADGADGNSEPFLTDPEGVLL